MVQVRGPKSGFRRTIPLRRNLRHSLTPPERLFWSRVACRNFFGLKFRKQHGLGNYIVDFYCAERGLVVEIDGDSHAESMNYDAERTAYIAGFGYTIIRYGNRDILYNLDGVMEDLAKKLHLL
jgi:very-short-patch-repair endonuclease